MTDGAKILSEFIDGELGIKPKKSANTKKHPLLEFIDKEVRSLLHEAEKDDPATRLAKSIGSGKSAEAIYETLVFIVAKLPGNKTMPSIQEIREIIADPQVVAEGRAWVEGILNSGDDALIATLPALTETIGADIKKLPGFKWGPKLQIIHDGIKQYYDSIPPEFVYDDLKSNTADMVIISKGKIEDVLNSLSTKEVQVGADNSIHAGNTSFKQVSLKKAKGGARIGKLSAFINQRYGQQAMSPRKLAREGARDKLKGALSSVASFIKSKVASLKKMAFGVLRVGQKAAHDAEDTTINQAASNIFSMASTDSTVGEGRSVLLEGTAMMNPAMREELNTLRREILAKDLVQKEYEQLEDKLFQIEQVFGQEGKSALPVVIENLGSDPKLDVQFFNKATDEILKIKDGEEIPKVLLSPILKITVNYASYRTFNTILEEVIGNTSSSRGVVDSILSFSSDMSADAIFGNTKLPLWIVYGMGGGAHNLGTKEEYAKESSSGLEDLLDDPYMVFHISKSKGKEQYNAIYMLLISGVQEKEGEIVPEYIKIQFINRSGSRFSYKIDAMANVTLK
jgi:hypothetical protein